MDKPDPRFHDAHAWLDEHGDALYRYALVRVRDPASAEDLVQETLLAALGARETPLPDEPDDDLLDAMFEDDPGQHWRSAPSVWASPAGALEQREFWQAFTDCLKQLPARQAEVFGLCELDGLSGEEACKVLGLSPSNLWVLMHRARLRLRQCLETRWFGKALDASRC